MLNIVIIHLRNESFQERLIKDFQVDLLLGLILRTIWYPSNSDPSLDPNNHGSVDTNFEDPLPKNEVEQLESSMDALFIILLDISSLPRFAINYPFESSLTSTLSSWLKSRRLDNMIVACSMLSGLARAKEVWARSMVSGPYRIHHDLINMIASETNTRHISITYNFLLQLARPVENRESICQPAFLWVAAYRWNGNDRDVQYKVTTVLRYLVRGCPPAVRNLLLLAPTTIPHLTAVVNTPVDDTELLNSKLNLEHQGTDDKDVGSSGSALDKRITQPHTLQDQSKNPSDTGQSNKIAKAGGTYLSLMLKLYMASDDSMVNAEIRRAVLEICRCFPLLSLSERALFVRHEDFATPLIHLIVGNGEPALRAQAYLAMVLMAREHSGRPIVQTIMKRKDISEQIVRDIAVNGINLIPEASEAMPKHISVDQWNNILRSVRENATWLVKDILEDPVSRILAV